ncbi:hypothetical protein MPH_07469 [Macrophomina phaseolina MS6]|uniref:Uncharacterized protein n=1 Tax=Macrophomina phaseolina (strain MS6) TaxID=1126212 RepID=K2QZC4_MACPH|nr:hypothetical protein MPH_07469 [Macrophomina phaseolina MS6]
MYEKECNRFGREKMALTATVEYLKTIIKCQEQDIVQLRESNEEMTKKCKLIKELWALEEDKHSKATEIIKGLMQEIREKDEEISMMNDILNVAQAKASRTKTSLNSCTEENSVLCREIRKERESLKELEGLAEQRNDGDWVTLVGRIENLWVSAIELVGSYFNRDLSPSILQNQDAWARIKAPDYFKYQIPLPSSNSSAAKLMRTTIILAILARLLNRYIFEPTYIVDEESGLREFLLHQAASHSKKEAFTRAMLLNIFSEEQLSAADERVSRVVQDTMLHICDLLPKHDADMFERDLKHFTSGACEVWLSIQRLKERFEPSFELVQCEDFDWEKIQLGQAEPSELEDRGHSTVSLINPCMRNYTLKDSICRMDSHVRMGHWIKKRIELSGGK